MDAPIILTKEKIGNYTIVKGKGDIVSENIDYFLKYFNEVSSEDEKYIIFDMSDIKYINSNGLGILMHISKNLSDINGNFFMCNITDSVKEMIQLIGAMNILNIHDDLNSVIASHPELVSE